MENYKKKKHPILKNKVTIKLNVKGTLKHYKRKPYYTSRIPCERG